MLSADKEVESCFNLQYNEAKHIRSSNAFVCVTPIVKFVVAIISPSKARNNILPFAIPLKSSPL